MTDSEFARLRDEIVNADVFVVAKTLRERDTFQREDGTPLQYTLVNIKDWCKNEFEVINQLRINTDNSHHRCDVILLINGVPVVQIELKALGLTPRRAMEQIVEYKNKPGNGYTHTLLCFMQLFIVSNRSDTFYFANNHRQHFGFNADERFYPFISWLAKTIQRSLIWMILPITFSPNARHSDAFFPSFGVFAANHLFSYLGLYQFSIAVNIRVSQIRNWLA